MKPYCGRPFSPDELQTIRRLIEDNPDANRAQLSRQVCVLFDWLKPNGELKDMTCRVAMLRMQADGLVALLSFGASAWKLAARERFIGWQEDERQRNLPFVVNNARFLILPWIQSKGLASKILSLIHRQLPNDWLARYGYRPVLLETFVETPRHRGTCYQAANWIKVGQTTGRGKKSPTRKPILPIKDIWLYPLHKNFRSILCR